MSLLLLFPQPTGGGASYSLTCDAGSYTYTGQDTTFVTARSMTGDAGAYTYTGQDATFVAARSLTADAGSYTYSGQDVTTSLARSLTADAGSYNYTGQDATLLLGKGLVAEAGSYIYTGQDIAFVAVIAPKGGGSINEGVNWERLNKLRRQQSYIKDDEEALALILAELTRRR